MSKNILEKTLETYFNSYLKGDKGKILDWQQNFEAEIIQNQHLPQEELDAKANSQVSSPFFLWAYAVLSVERNPYATYEALIRLYDINGATELGIAAGCVRPFYPKAYEMIIRCLQYGRFVDWKTEIAYTPEIDELVEHLIDDLDNPNLESTLQDYEEQYPDCNMLPILHAFWFLQRAQKKNGGINEDFMGHRVKKAAGLLTKAFDKEIPAKYKYFVASYLELCANCINGSLSDLARLSSSSITHAYCGISLSNFLWFLVVCLYKLFPTINNKKALREMTVTLDDVKNPLHKNRNLTQKIFFNPNFTVKDAFEEAQKEFLTCQTEQNEDEDDFGLLMMIIGSFIGIILLLVFLLNISSK